MKTIIIAYAIILSAIIIPSRAFTESAAYKALGVGGGGALSGMAISPYGNLWFVGTDMGTLFRSTDSGRSWHTVKHSEAMFGTDLSKAVSPGFSSDKKTIFHSENGLSPKRSSDAGLTFKPISLPLLKDEIIRYWATDTSNAAIVFCGTNQSLLASYDNGTTWIRIKGIVGNSSGTFFDLGSKKTIYHAAGRKIYSSVDNGKTFTLAYTAKTTIRAFTGGRDKSGYTLAFADSDGMNACRWASGFISEWGAEKIDETQRSCGYVWLSINGSLFSKTSMVAGDHVKMAENDSSVIYVTGGKKWIRQYGTKIHVSKDKGQTWTLKLHQLNWDVVPYQPWPQDKLEYSAVALDVGWWDDGYESFDVNKTNSSIAAGAGLFFIHSTFNAGDKWLAPFTQFAESNLPSAGKYWKTRGIEVISVYKTKFHPTNPKLLYAASADIGGMISEDRGETFRISKAQYNSNYDYAFDTDNDSIVYAASGNTHDYPNEWYANSMTSNGGIYLSENRGQTWKRLTPDNKEFNRQFLSVAYDTKNNVIYAGSQESGIAVSGDQGKSWKYMNEGLPSGVKIIPQIEIDPVTGNVFALVTGNAPLFTNHAQTGIYVWSNKPGGRWILLRKHVHAPADLPQVKRFWYYPTKFALDLRRNTLWLIDYENNGNWLQTGVWKSTDMGNNWYRVSQFTHPTDIIVDSKNPDHIHVAGYFDMTGKWGVGGQIFSKDGGKTWEKNNDLNLQHNARSVTKDPSNPARIIYTFFGGGILSGPDPIH